MDATWECIVVGGGAAGLSAALVLGRARRRTLVVDAGQQSNRPAHGIGGFLGSDGLPPAELSARGRAELAKYPTVEVRDGEVVEGAPGFTLELADGSRETTKRVLLSTGMEYRRPDLPGLEPLWGDSVFHCPFCHGWEARDGALAVLADPAADPALAVHGAKLLRFWSDDVVLLANGAPVEGLEAAGVPVDPRPVAALEAAGGRLAAVRFADGERMDRDGLLVRAPLAQRSALAASLGVDAAPPTPIALDGITPTPPFGATNVPGVFVAGDLTGQMPQVATAVATGSTTAAGVVASLLEELA